MEWSKKYFIKKLIKCIIWFDIASEEIELNANPFNPFFMSGSGSNLSIYYSSGPICYDKKTLILINKNGNDVYKRISELKVGDLVKTYKND